MVKKRIIPLLLFKNGRLVKGIEFSNFRETGKAESAIKIYSSQDADEIFLINISDADYPKDAFLELIRLASQECRMPLCVGGKVEDVKTVELMLRNGADKVLINTMNYLNINLLTKSSTNFGRQAITAGIDVRRLEKRVMLYSQNGKNPHEINLTDHIIKLQEGGCGEIFLNSIDHDGKMKGYDLSLIYPIKDVIKVPLILGGGAGNFSHLYDALNIDIISGVVCGSLFQFADNNPIRARAYLKNQGIRMRNV